MKVIGILCEYNPFHLGHRRQFDVLRAQEGDSCGIVCLMSGDYVQRGHPGILEKSLRAAAAVACGADLVLEMPVTQSLSSAEGFAAGGVRILSPFCDGLSFGTESGNAASILTAAQALLREDFPENLKQCLSLGISFPAARQLALEKMGCDTTLLRQPNDILAVEYAKAILQQKSGLEILPIPRSGSYHALTPDAQSPAASALRLRMENGGNWLSYVPENARKILASGTIHSLSYGEKAILYRLRTMSDGEFEALPYGSEGLWRKLMRESRRCGSTEEILTAVKSKRYTRSRLERMLLCAVLGITQADISRPAPYARVLALNSRGGDILARARATGSFPNLGEKVEGPYAALEARCAAIYPLFAQNPQKEPRPRVYAL